VEGRSIVEDRRPRNSYHRVCYVFVAQAVSACHWNWTAMGDGQRPTEGDSHLRYISIPNIHNTGIAEVTMLTVLLRNVILLIRELFVG